LAPVDSSGTLDKVAGHEQQAVIARLSHRRAALIVAGMHRSGTSALTRVLNLLGCDNAKNLWPPGPANQRGYWESPQIAALNDRMLASLGLAWNSWESIDPAWFQSPKADEFRDEAIDVIGAQYGRSGLMVLKDPRICRLLPIWTSALEALDVAPHVILDVRRPVEVAASLLVRDGLNSSLSQLIWLRHVLDAEAYSRGMARACLRYDDLLDDWRSAISRVGESLGGFNWPRRSSTALMEIDQFVTKSLRHHGGDAGNDGLAIDFSPWVREAWRIMARWCAAGIDEADHSRLDLIHAAFNGAEQSFARVILEHQVQSAELTTQVEALRTTVEELQVPRIDPAVPQLEAEKASLADEITQLRAREAELSTTADQLSSELSAARTALADFQAEAEARIAAMEASLAGARAAAEGSRLLLAEGGSLMDVERQENARLYHRAELMRQWIASGGCVERDSRAQPPSTLEDGGSEPLEADLALILKSPFFDEQWYLERYRDVAEAGGDPARHYLLYGAAEGRDPGPLFDTRAYAALWPEVVADEVNALVHFMRWTAGEEADNSDAMLVARSSLFDADHYLRTNPDVVATGTDPLAHFLTSGGMERRDPGPRFSSRAYLARRPDVAAAGINPLVHFLRYGLFEDPDAAAQLSGSPR
jgi:hypothetical protein